MRAAVLALLFTLSGTAFAAPQAYSPALALYHTDSADNPSGIVQVSITGDGFGSPGSTGGTFAVADCGTQTGGYFVVVYSGLSPVLTAGSTNTATVTWTPKQVILKLSAANGALSPLSVRICTPGGQSSAAAITKWILDHVDVPGTVGTNASPLAVARDANGNVWVNEEFHLQVKRLTYSPLWWTKYPVPQASGPGIFAWAPPGTDIRTPMAAAGEDVIVDPLGRVWFTETGSTPYFGVNPNHSRIVMFDPQSLNVRTLNLPGDRNGVFGLSWDPLRARIWFTETRRALGPSYNETIAYRARVTSFDPVCIGNIACTGPNYNTPVWNGTFNFDAEAATWTCVGGSTSPPAVGTCQNASGNNGRKCFTSHDCSLSYLRCPSSGGYDYWCFHEYEIPDGNEPVLLPAHVLAHSDGTIWYSAYWGGGHIGRLDPATGGFQRYPLANPSDQATLCGTGCVSCGDPNCPGRCCSYALLHSGPWSLVEESSRNVAMSFQNQPAVGQFDFSRANDPACLQLDGSGQNPCISEYFIPNFDRDTQFTHSAQMDAAGNVWLSQAVGTGGPENCGSLTSVGYLQVNTKRMLMFPPLSFYSNTSGACTVGVSATGMAYDPSTGGMWFADYWRKRIDRIRPQ